MSKPSTPNALKQYQQVAIQSSLDSATPHRLIQMLLDGALDRIATARGHMERHDIAQKGSQITWTISIIDGLRLSLDMEQGGEIAKNLWGLYDYMRRRLIEANRIDDAKILDEVTGLLREIKGAWEAIGPEVNTQMNPEAADAAAAGR